MFRLGVVCSGVFMVAVLLACCGTGAPRNDRPASSATSSVSQSMSSGESKSSGSPPVRYPYQFIESRTESKVPNNTMDLYHYDGVIDGEELKAFCRDRKNACQHKGNFYYVVIFDTREHARFPETPFGAEYAAEDTLKWIRAFYLYGIKNGASSLRYHQQNIFEHFPIREKP